MPPFDNSIYFPHEARRGSSRLYFPREKATLRMASIILSSQQTAFIPLFITLFKDQVELFPAPQPGRAAHLQRRASAIGEF